MKCACGYEYEESYDKEHKCMIPIKGDESFLLSELNITYNYTEGSYYKTLESRTVYICPECGTLKIDI